MTTAKAVVGALIAVLTYLAGQFLPGSLPYVVVGAALAGLAAYSTVFAVPNKSAPALGVQLAPVASLTEPRFTLAEIDAIRALLAGAPPSPTQPPTMQGATRR